MDDINDGTTADSSGIAGRYSLRSEKNKFLQGNDNHLEEHSTTDHDNNSSSSSSSSSSSISDDDDPPLSEYELLRLRNIKRNEARLAQLGLLVPAAAAAASAKRSSNNRQSGNNAGEITSSALTTLLLASPAQTSKKKKRKKQDDTAITEPLPRRILPKRNCTSRYSDDASDEESSVAASPILPKRILTLQPHQAAALDNNKNVTQCVPRRERRGRPKREDYVYECDEKCGHCGGEWKLDGGEDLEEETRLIRCKDCRGAFHLDCMMLHGKSEAIDDEASSSCKENKSAMQETLQEDVVRVQPKRCFQCECNKSKCAKRKKEFAPILEAKVGKKKIVTVRVTPEPVLEAVVRGANVMCYVSLKK